MSLFHCRFCDHANPPGARFCNECGSPLYLKPCPQCEAVNDAAAPQCFQCGAVLPKDEAEQEASVATMPEFSNATESSGDLGGAAQRSAPGAFTERFEIEFGEFRPSLFDDSPAGAAASERATSDAPVIVGLRQTAPAESASNTHHRKSATRTGLFPMSALLVLAFIVFGAAAYYVYEHSAADTKVADAGAASSSSAQQEPAAEAKAPSATLNDAAPPPTETTPQTDSTTNPAAAGPAAESANTSSKSSPQESAGPRVEPPAASKARSTPETRRHAAGTPGKSVAAQPARPAASSDASAIATQRIIERELGTRAAPSPATRTP
jgi:cytoskeletal protein RodZ